MSIVCLFVILGTVNMFRAKPKVDLPTKFFGNGAQSADHFVESWERLAPVAEWDEEDMARYFPLVLDGTAIFWYTSLCGVVAWKDLKRSFLETFNTPIDRDCLELKMHKRVYNPSAETITAYYFEKV